MEDQAFGPDAKPEFHGALHDAPYESLDLATSSHGMGRESGVMPGGQLAATPIQPAVAGLGGITTGSTQ
ncbi:hypothetical protein C0989_010240, partial [Termitomyces sp. Mn162]